MSEQPYTPTTDECRDAYATMQQTLDGMSVLAGKDRPIRPVGSPHAEFDRWLARVKADALREAAATDDPDHYTEVALGGGDYVRDWLNARADRIESGR